QLLFVVVSGITPAKDDLAIREGNQAMVGDGHTMGVAAEILQHIFGTTKGRFQVDHPVLPVQRPQPGSEDLGLRKKLQVSLEVELAILESLLKSGDEQAGRSAATAVRAASPLARRRPTGESRLASAPAG